MNGCPRVWALEQTDANAMKPRHKSFQIQNELGAKACWNPTLKKKKKGQKQMCHLR